MKIDSIRFKAFTTNSSSVHTPILVTDKMPNDYMLENGYDFGWGPFVAASPEAKRYYAALVLQNNLMDLPEGIRDAVIKDWTGVTLVKGDDSGYIDHQSIPVLPMEFAGEYEGKGISKEYFMDYLKWVMQEKLVILGGNDNDDETGPDVNGERLDQPYEKDENHKKFVVRKDPKGFYTLFNKEDGTRVRMSFDNKVDTSKGSAPELVDLKITNRCNSECNYCYQGSCPKGAHANSEFVKYTIMRALGEMKVFEVALGGGEPTLHPDFWSFLKEAVYFGIKPSFSTRELSWLEDPTKRRIFKETCGAFALSVDGEGEVLHLIKAMHKHDLEDYVTIQYIPEANTFQDLKGVLEIADMHSIPVTLLGFKTTGRGAEYRERNKEEPITPEQWKSVIDGSGNISVDTAFASSHAEVLKAAGVAEWSYKIKEGAHSMYIDAVTGELAPSSYSDMSQRIVVPTTMRGADNMMFEIMEAFKDF